MRLSIYPLFLGRFPCMQQANVAARHPLESSPTCQWKDVSQGKKSDGDICLVTMIDCSFIVAARSVLMTKS